MKDADFIYGARSGIQKGIRRGDLDLVHTCFEALWGDVKQRQWLKWRATTLVTEDAWQMIGEYGKLVDSGDESKEVWRKFIYQLCFATKAKDTVGLWFLAHDWNSYPIHPEFDELALWRNMCGNADEDYLSLADDMYNTYLNSRVMTDYEKSGLKMMRSRVKKGGMIADRFVCLSGMLLLYMRGIREEEVIDDIKVNATKWKEINGRSKPKIVSMPWYAFDFHTQAGKIASGIFMRHSANKYNLTKVQFQRLWFHLESAKVPKWLIKPVSVLTEKPTCFETAWWIPLISSVLKYDGKSPKEVAKLWRDKIREDIKGAVLWILDKREGD